MTLCLSSELDLLTNCVGGCCYMMADTGPLPTAGTKGSVGGKSQIMTLGHCCCWQISANYYNKLMQSHYNTRVYILIIIIILGHSSVLFT